MRKEKTKSMAKENRNKKHEEPEEISENRESVETPLESEIESEAEDPTVDLVAELARAKEKEETLMNALARERADFTNYRRLVETEKKNASDEYKISVLKKILPILDDMELAVRNRIRGDVELDEWAQGIELIARKYRSIVEGEGVKSSAAVGEPFDPRFHQAIAQEENPDAESGPILEGMSNGYILGERTLKTALVRVAA